ncbi:hypothetical protein PVAND_008611 [Polypedilum vanderplanki]|uniref:NADH dehydrogenase [ubiquinone] 1 alpha subcomplex subunit 11 n=1 Tax=Polypedilum vanderplanki TaxID=319348 RepID=A0A9J6CAB6_POLVA|nr:hypothetical protein PVAND_008611 [Polypedilum vanderplanki]
MDYILKQQYYQKPDGQDFTGKMIATNKYMFAFAAPMAVVDVLMYSHPKGILSTIGCFAKWVGPAAGMATFFTAGTYFSTVIRGKDDKLNYAIGGVSAAAVFGKAIRNPAIGFQAAVAFAVAGMLKKISIEEGWTWFPTAEEVERKHVYGTLKTAKYDFTIMKDTPEKGWTTNPREA